MGGKIRGPRTVLEEKLHPSGGKGGEGEEKEQSNRQEENQRREKAEECLGVSAGQED